MSDLLNDISSSRDISELCSHPFRTINILFAMILVILWDLELVMMKSVNLPFVQEFI